MYLSMSVIFWKGERERERKGRKREGRGYEKFADCGRERMIKGRCKGSEERKERKQEGERRISKEGTRFACMIVLNSQ